MNKIPFKHGAFMVRSDGDLYDCECRFGHLFTYDINKPDTWCYFCENPVYRQTIIDDHNKRFKMMGVKHALFDMDKYGKVQLICDSNHVFADDLDTIPSECPKCEAYEMTQSVVNMGLEPQNCEMTQSVVNMGLEPQDYDAHGILFQSPDSKDEDPDENYRDGWMSDATNTDYWSDSNKSGTEEMDEWICAEQEEAIETEADRFYAEMFDHDNDEIFRDFATGFTTDFATDFVNPPSFQPQNNTAGLRKNSILLKTGNEYAVCKKEDHDIFIALEYAATVNL